MLEKFLSLRFKIAIVELAGLAGLEPATSGFGDRRSTNWTTGLPFTGFLYAQYVYGKNDSIFFAQSALAAIAGSW